MPEISLVPSQFIPTTSVAGGEPMTVFRGRNAFIRNVGGNSYVEVYPGSKNLGETYLLSDHQLPGTLTFTAGSINITGTGTSFLDDLAPGMMLLAGTDVLVVNRIESNTLFTADRPATVTSSAVTYYALPRLFEINRKRGVLRRGNAISQDRKDIIMVGRGPLYLNGVNTGFTAASRPKRLELQADGTYVERVFGFNTSPPTPKITGVAGGWKDMLPGNYSFMVSWWNDKTNGYSNPSARIKKMPNGADIVLSAGWRFTIDVSDLLPLAPANASGIRIWGTLSGGNVPAVNAENFHTGVLLYVKDMPFAPKTVTAVDPTNDTITIPNHGFTTGDFLFYTRTGGASDIGGLTNNSGYFIEVIDSNTIKVAATTTNFKNRVFIDLTSAGSGTQTFGYFNNANTAFFEYLDAELGIVVTGDNDPPPECEWVEEFSNRLFYISCFGRRKSDNPFGSSPGNYVVPAKDSNIEAAPYRWRVTVEDEITGYAKGVGRLFCQTSRGVWFVTATGRTELARLTPTPIDMPFTSRPLWSKGGISPYNLTVVQADVFSISGGQPYRSPSLADDRLSPFEIGKIIRDLIKNITDGYMYVVHDPFNQHLCVILSAVRKNSDGFWESEILPLDLSINPPVWQPKVVLTSPDRDMIVSGAAIINNRLEFLAGGREKAAPSAVKAYRYAERSGSGTISWAIAFQPTDFNEETRAKYIRSFRATGQMSSPTVQVHGISRNARVLDPNNIELGLASLTGNIPLAPLTSLARSYRVKRLVKDLEVFSVRIADTWTDTGTNSLARLDELVIEGGIRS